MLLTLLFGTIVGLSLGLTGGGGSIFAVPLLVYGLGMDLRRAVAVSLAVVGLTALYGAILQARRGQVLWGAGALIGLGGIAAAPIGARIGAELSATASLLMFAALMIFIGIRMLFANPGGSEVPLEWMRCERKPNDDPKFSGLCATKLFGVGVGTGILAGIFGVGGGFLVVPALLLVACTEINRALATSLVGIFLIAVSGFAANAHAMGPDDVIPALQFLVGGAIGMTGGAWFKKGLSPLMLQRTFGLAVLGTALFLVVKNLGGIFN